MRATPARTALGRVATALVVGAPVMALGAGCHGAAPDAPHDSTPAISAPGRPGDDATAASNTAGGASPPPPTAAVESSHDAGPRASPARWDGSYHSTAGTLYIPPEWKGVRWSVPDNPAGLGDGTMTCTLDRTTGRVQGRIDGPLGPATVDGTVDGDTMTATILRLDPADRGFSGTLAASFADATWSGTMHVSLAEASAVRTAVFSLSPAR